MARVPLYLLLLILPLAVAGHNIGTGVVALMLFTQIYLRRATLSTALHDVWRDYRVPLLACAGFIACVMIGGVLNETQPKNTGGSFFFGYLIWTLLPPVVWLATKPLSERDWFVLARVVAVVAGVLGAVAVAQAHWGFRLQGAHFVAGPTRAQGFYSHPLTFAYVGLLLVPIGSAMAMKAPRRIVSWVTFLGAIAVVYASQSRTVQVLAGLLVVANCLWVAQGSLRWGLLGVISLAAVVLVSTDNPVRYRFSRTIAGIDVRSGYAGDDRLAFWDAHLEMFKERPLLGHGDNTDTAYRKPYYERLGLGNFERQYEAHNTYIQVAVNGGLAALAAFLIWLGWHVRLSFRMARLGFGGKVALQTFVAFAVGALTQNAFQDSEVRYGLTLVATALWLSAKVRL